jgi:hypothetical protein
MAFFDFLFDKQPRDTDRSGGYGSPQPGQRELHPLVKALLVGGGGLIARNNPADAYGLGQGVGQLVYGPRRAREIERQRRRQEEDDAREQERIDIGRDRNQILLRSVLEKQERATAKDRQARFETIQGNYQKQREADALTKLGIDPDTPSNLLSSIFTSRNRAPDNPKSRVEEMKEAIIESIVRGGEFPESTLRALNIGVPKNEDSESNKELRAAVKQQLMSNQEYVQALISDPVKAERMIQEAMTGGQEQPVDYIFDPVTGEYSANR